MILAGLIKFGTGVGAPSTTTAPGLLDSQQTQWVTPFRTAETDNWVNPIQITPFTITTL